MRDTLEGLFPGCGSDPALGIDENAAARKADSTLRVEFFKHPVPDHIPTNGGHIDVNAVEPEKLDEWKALGCRIRKHPKEQDILIVEKCGRPVMREATFIRIQRPGDRDLINERPVTEHDKRRFAEAWDRHLKGEDAGVAGTPLTEMPFINTAMRAELAYFGVVTGEQLVGMTDLNAAKFPYMNRLRPMVQRYLDAKAADAPFKARDAKVASLEETVQALQAQLAAMQAAKEEAPAPTPPEPEEAKPQQPQPRRR